MKFSIKHHNYIKFALEQILGKAFEGALVYVRCINSDIIQELFDIGPFTIDGWNIYAVIGEASGDSYISADKAVDIRESKQESVCLFVDPRTAGPGMDGIYSAGKEITENYLFDVVNHIIRKEIRGDDKKFVDKAIKEAKKQGTTKSIAPMKEFDFLAHCVDDIENMGKYLAILGLWPIKKAQNYKIEDIDISSAIVDKLIKTSGSANTPRNRIESLMLVDVSEEQLKVLEAFVRENDVIQWRDTVMKLADRPNLWLNEIKPGFNSQELLEIELVPWRGANGKIVSWTGLKQSNDDDSAPIFYIPSDDDTAKKPKLEVRWKTKPAGLKYGAVEYKVSILTGSDNELVVPQTITHSGKDTQRCVFTDEHFEELDENGKWEVRICIHPIGEVIDFDDIVSSKKIIETEEFIITYGTPESTSSSSVGKKVRALVEEAIKLKEEDDFDKVCQAPTKEDKKNYITWVCRNSKDVSISSGRVYRSPALKLIEENWKDNSYEIGRWSLKVRNDGTRLEDPQFHAIDTSSCGNELKTRVENESRLLANQAENRCGFAGMIYHNNEKANNYVNAWTSLCEKADPELALANTLEIQNIKGDTIGLVVLPHHPSRVAWHQAYDELAYCARYIEDNSLNEVKQMLLSLDGSYMPAYLPGIDNKGSFVFGDTVGFFTVIMLKDDEKEPQAVLATISKCLIPNKEDADSLVNQTSAIAISKECDKYIKTHDTYHQFRINALRPGDGYVITEALGKIHSGDDEDDSNDETREVGFLLDMFPSDDKYADMVGSYLMDVTERRRSGPASITKQERWILKTFKKDANIIPFLKWAKRNPWSDYESDGDKIEHAHLSLGFDMFDSSLKAESGINFKDNNKLSSIEAFGLCPTVRREFSFNPVPTWRTMVYIEQDGEKHPLLRSLTERIQKIHSHLLHLTAMNLGGARDSWPVLETKIENQQAEDIKRLHELSDWVITVDRNGGIEYFDAPSEAPDIYDTYVIDCVPERDDLDCVRLVTSTCNIDEVKKLLKKAIEEMSLSISPNNCNELLSNLKAISGRLAMRISHKKDSYGELIALAHFYNNCKKSGTAPWISLQDGFIVPIDDIQDILGKESQNKKKKVDADSEEEDTNLMRSDLVYVTLNRTGALEFKFVEIKHRKLLRDSIAQNLYAKIYTQLKSTRDKWQKYYFDENITKTLKVVRRKRLSRALRFYLDKAKRHGMPDEVHAKLALAIDKLNRSDAKIAEDSFSDAGYIFCPEHDRDIVEVDSVFGDRIYRFGLFETPNNTDKSEKIRQPKNKISSNPTRKTQEEEKETMDKPEVEVLEEDNVVEDKQSDNVRVLIGNRISDNEDEYWDISIKSNPHLMMVGQPGMGKTTSLINICEQLYNQGIVPIIFSYHPDIEEKLALKLPDTELIDLNSGLGFNPMKVVHDTPKGWIDNVGMLRDIFTGIFPDFGDIQANEIRVAIRDSYKEKGYGDSCFDNQEKEIPEFQTFYDKINQNSKANKGVKLRLDELNDYGFFNTSGDLSSLLESKTPQVIRLHTTHSEVVQRALASFVLLNIYQYMFIRGEQTQLTHAIIFDEAHRASRLKLIPTMAKECRKFGLSLIVASQAAKDFPSTIYEAISNYLVLRVIEPDAKEIVKNTIPKTNASNYINRLIQLKKYSGLLIKPGSREVFINLKS